ncbi:MAG: hypothetical protein ACI9C4_000994, partial [Paraglaciecola sp.]
PTTALFVLDIGKICLNTKAFTFQNRVNAALNLQVHPLRIRNRWERFKRAYFVLFKFEITSCNFI